MTVGGTLSVPGVFGPALGDLRFCSSSTSAPRAQTLRTPPETSHAQPGVIWSVKGKKGWEWNRGYAMPNLALQQTAAAMLVFP
jgi:hypothetical protein